jgi:hypothetical protein
MGGDLPSVGSAFKVPWPSHGVWWKQTDACRLLAPTRGFLPLDSPALASTCLWTVLDLLRAQCWICRVYPGQRLHNGGRRE